ncbi:MAG TPA: pyridoxamine 5'-phosphate oxidase [Saprospiraceae bacterium]|nr:pyridoxamine 5'-phosphate oxidase [Saprospiraceae bacterium]
MALNLHDLRREYAAHTLDISDVNPDPIQQFKHWFEEALSSKVLEPNAMVLSTIKEDMRPSARVVLLKEFNQEGFVFYTNYNSNKGEQLTANPLACLVFNWLELQRQVKIEGKVEKVAPEVSTQYFQSRPRGSQIGAWTSPQSRIIEDRDALEKRQQKMEERFAGQEEIPRPEHWGGFIVIPDLIEFWQGRPSRLHDRVQYSRQEKAGNWKIERLAP